MKPTILKCYNKKNKLVVSALTETNICSETKIISTVSELTDFITRYPTLTAVRVPEKSSEEPLPTPTKTYFVQYPGAKYSAVKTSAKYPKIFPERIVIKNGTMKLSDLLARDWSGIIITKKGNILQYGDLTAYNPSFATDNISYNVLLENAGQLIYRGGQHENYFTGEIIPEANIRYRDGYYEMLTPEQELSLLHVCRDLVIYSGGLIPIQNVVGLEETSKTSFPGGSLSMTMPDFRKTIRALGVK